jgi:hypothetical protein
MERRELLGGLAGASALALAGCSSTGDDGGDGGDGRQEIPRASFEAAYDADAGEVAVTHAGGASFTEETTSELRLVGGDETLATFETPVEPGDSVTAETDAGTVLRIVWYDAAGEYFGTIQRLEVEPLSTPQATFSFGYDDGVDEVEITHTGGDTFSAGNSAALTVQYDDTSRAWSLPVQAGSSLTVPASGGEEIRVIWEAPVGDRTQTVATFFVPS